MIAKAAGCAAHPQDRPLRHAGPAGHRGAAPLCGGRGQGGRPAPEPSKSYLATLRFGVHTPTGDLESEPDELRPGCSAQGTACGGCCPAFSAPASSCPRCTRQSRSTASRSTRAGPAPGGRWSARPAPSRSSRWSASAPARGRTSGRSRCAAPRAPISGCWSSRSHERLGTVAVMSGLRRTASGDFTLEDAHPMEEILGAGGSGPGRGAAACRWTASLRRCPAGRLGGAGEPAVARRADPCPARGTGSTGSMPRGPFWGLASAEGTGRPGQKSCSASGRTERRRARCAKLPVRGGRPGKGRRESGAAAAAGFGCRAAVRCEKRRREQSPFMRGSCAASRRKRRAVRGHERKNKPVKGSSECRI